MKFYLSSYKMGNETDKLKEMIKTSNKKTALISNALDFSTDLARRKESEDRDINELQKHGLLVDLLDLRNYFEMPADLESKLNEYGVIWVRGGNVFVLRQAMKLSRLDEILKGYYKNNKDILYGGFSAGICVLGPTLKGIHLTDDPNIKPYGDYETIWEGLGILDYTIAPHYQSNHPESESIQRSVQYMIENNMSYKPLRDGEVIVFDQSEKEKIISKSERADFII